MENKLSTFQFDEWIFYAEQNRLYNRETEKTIELEYKVASLLLYFCQFPQRTCQKDEIINSLWSDRVVNDDSLNVAVSKLRKLLGDSARHPNYVKTIPGKGYQFLVPVHPVDEITKPVDHSTLQLSKQTLSLIAAIIILAGFWLYFPNSSSSKVAATTVSPKIHEQLKSIEHSLNQVDDSKHLDLINQLKNIIVQHPDAADAYTLLLRAKFNFVLRHHADDLHLYKDEFLALAEKALSLNSTNPKSLALRARIAMFLEWDFKKSAEYYQQAHLLAPNNYQVTQEYAEFMFFVKNKQQGLALLDELRMKKPELFNSPAIPYMHLIAGQSNRAYQEIKAQLHSQKPTEMHWVIAQRIGMQVGEETMAAEALFSLLPLRGFTPDEIELCRSHYQQGGIQAVYAHLLNTREERYVGQYQGALAFARYAILSGQPELAMPYVERAFKDKYVGVLWLDVDPLYDVLNEYSAYRSLKAELNKKRQQVEI